MHGELSSRNGNWKRSFNRKRIKRALSAEIIPEKILSRGRKRVSSREQVALEAAAAAKATRSLVQMTSVPTTTSGHARSSITSASKTPATSTLRPSPSLTTDELAMRHMLSEQRPHHSSGKGKGIDRGTPAKKQSVNTYLAATVERKASANHVVAPSGSGLLRDETYVATKSKASEDVRARDSELCEAREPNAVLQSRLDEFSEGNKVLERDALSVQKIKKVCDDKLAKLKSRCTKAEGEIVLLRGERSSASDFQSTRIGEPVAEAKDEMAHGFGPTPPDLSTEVKALCERCVPIYDARDVFEDLLACVQRELEIPEVYAPVVEADVAADDDVEVGATDGYDAEVTDVDEEIVD
ncbi:hypothetical protein AALP_AAs73299U000200 [Arabis alpina]|uniref:Uncharacterized protein n=1 Tax=Arabis alpina TaxID=50452 RepID=A0A087G2R2_ARAAL|nr:hypothetical protein AALP_AAs73299U000200 [Arabis alpina]